MPCGRSADIAKPDIALTSSRARNRLAEAAAAGSFEPNDVPGFYIVRDFGAQRLLLTVPDQVAARSARGLSTGEPNGRNANRSRLVESCAIGQSIRHSRQRPSPRATGRDRRIGQQSVTHERHRHIAFDHLHWVWRCYACERERRRAVRNRQRADTADLDLDENATAKLGSMVSALPHRKRVISSRHALRHGLMQRTEQHRSQPVANGDAMHYGRWRGRTPHRPGGAQS